MSEISQYLADLRTELNKTSNRPAKGELLARSREIPLVWPAEEYPIEAGLVGAFRAAHEAWGGKMHEVGGEGEVAGVVREILREAGVKRITRWTCPELDVFDFENSLGDLDLEWILPSPEEIEAAGDFESRKTIRNRLAAIDAGITSCDGAAAHTGTLLLRHSGGRDGFTNLLGWTYIAIVRLSQMVKTVEELITRLGEMQKDEPWKASTVFITGPSRSGDIDLTVGQGAAGPGQMHVIVVNEE